MSSHDEEPPTKRGRGIGTVIVCFAIAVGIGSVLDSGDNRVKKAAAREAARDEAAERTTPDSDDVTSYKVNKGHVIVVPTTGAASIDMNDDMRAHAQIKVNGKRTTITVDDDFSDDSKIKISIPATDACRVELSAGLLEIKRLPCADTELIVRSGKMEVTEVPKTHGKLSGSVSVGTVKIDAGNGKESRSAGVGDLRADVPGTGAGPNLTARVDVGMLTVDVE